MESHQENRPRGRPRQVTDDALALLLARYRLRSAGTTRAEWLDGLAERIGDDGRIGSTYGGAWSASSLAAGVLPPPPRRWLRADSIRWHIDAAESRCRRDGAFAERVAMYGRLLALLDESPAEPAQL